MNPKISIIIPTFNRDVYLSQTIESALAQKYSNYEVIISDNASTDNTAELVSRYLNDKRLKYYKNDMNIGMVKNWHKALHEYSTGEWFLILSDDDYFIDNNYLSKCVELINKDKKIHMIYANGYIKYEDTGEVVKLDIPFGEINDGKKIFLSRNQVKPQDFTLCNIIFNKEESLKFKPFENEFNIGCDSELFLYMCLKGKVAFVKEYVSIYRIHSSNLMKQINSSWDIFINNHDYLLNPYVLAKQLNLFSTHEIENFENNVLLPYLTNTLLTSKVYFPDKTDDYIKYIKNKDRNIVEKILYKTKSNLRFLLANFPFFYKLILKVVHTKKRLYQIKNKKKVFKCVE